MARPLKPLVKSGGYYPSRRWTPLVYPGGYTTANGGGQPEPEAVLKTVTGSLIHITDALALPAEALSVNVEPIQAGTGDPSPDNVRPISGRTSATVTRTGRNLLPEPSAENAVKYNGSSLTVSNVTGGISVTGQKGGSSHAVGYLFGKVDNYIGKPLTLSCKMSTVGGSPRAMILLCNENFQSRSDTYFFDATGSVTATFQTGKEGKYIGVAFFSTSGSDSASITSTYTDIQLELGSTASDYAPYQGNTYTIQLGDTVYGGTLDVTGGKMVVTHMLFNRNSATMNNSNAYPGWNDAGLKALGYTGSGYVINTLLNVGTKYAYNCDGNNDILFLGTGEYHLTQEEWKALALDIQIVIPLVTPIEITLTPTQIDMLLGENNLWADDGDSTLTYYADGNASTSEALGILLGGTYNNPGGADDVSDDEALGILLGGS